jgi:hypothetical protein
MTAKTDLQLTSASVLEGTFLSAMMSNVVCLGLFGGVSARESGGTGLRRAAVGVTDSAQRGR